VKDAWYGDKRDLIKWGALVRLACHNRARKIIQVAFFRPTVLNDRPHLESEGQEWPVAEEVWFHFRDLRSIRHLARRCGLKIDVLGTRFDHANRDKYFRDVVRALEAAKGRKVVLLDPDTGTEPTKRTGHTSVATKSRRYGGHCLHTIGWCCINISAVKAVGGMKSGRSSRGLATVPASTCSRRQEPATWPSSWRASD